MLREFRKRFRRKRPALFKSGQWHFHKDNAPVRNSTLVTGYLTKMGVKTVPQLSYSLDLALCDFWLFPKLIGCRYETIEEMKEAVTKVIDTLTQVDFHGALQKLLERYNKCIAAGGDYFKGDYSFMCVLSIKVPIQKKSVNLLYALRISNISLMNLFLCLVETTAIVVRYEFGYTSSYPGRCYIISTLISLKKLW